MLGIDPGSRVTGWGLVRGPVSRPALEGCGTIRLPVGVPFAERLNRLREEIEHVARMAGPCCAAVETPFHGANARSALQLAHARGVILAALAAHGIAVSEYEPATVKKAVVGNGRADKQQVKAMVGHLLSTEVPGDTADPFDALAVALCHLQVGRHRDAVGAALARQEATRRGGRR